MENSVYRKWGFLERRADIIRSIREFFYSRNYLEVETPVRIPCPIPEAHIDPFDSDGWCLQASPEICMKQMLARGYERIFQIARVFRKAERGSKHLPEFSLLEWYTAGATYAELMDQIEALFIEIAAGLGLKKKLSYQGYVIDLTPPWDCITVEEAFETIGRRKLSETLSDDSYDEVMGCVIEPELGLERPVFLYDYPASKASLARLKKGCGKVAERVELYIAGIELANGYTELIDSEEQTMRFIKEQDIRKSLGKKNYPLPERFIRNLSNMPQCAGIAAGLDRIIMLFCDTTLIDDVVAFVPEKI